MPYRQLIINICNIIIMFGETPGQQLEHHEKYGCHGVDSKLTMI